MIEETGVVKKVEGDQVWIETQIKSSCGSCQVNKNCGTSVVAKAFATKPELLKMTTTYQLCEGQIVKLGIPEEQLLAASMLVYLLPILLLIASVSGLQYFFPTLAEGWQVLFSLVISAIGFWRISIYAKSQDKGQFSPLILGAVNETTVTMKNEIPTKKII